MTGGAGADEFKFSAGHGRDTITDFDATEDAIMLGSVEIDLDNVPSQYSFDMEGDDGVLDFNNGTIVVIEDFFP